MKILFLLPIIAVLIFFVPLQSYEHRDGCHSKHSCPSDSGSYICGDLGYDSECPVKITTSKKSTEIATWPEPVITPDPPKLYEPSMESWKNFRGEIVLVFSTSIDKLLERGYLLKQMIVPTDTPINEETTVKHAKMTYSKCMSQMSISCKSSGNPGMCMSQISDSCRQYR